MSMTYWGIVGYGVCLDDLDPHLNNEKVNKLIREMNPDIVFEGDVQFARTLSNPKLKYCEVILQE